MTPESDVSMTSEGYLSPNGVAGAVTLRGRSDIFYKLSYELSLNRSNL